LHPLGGAVLWLLRLKGHFIELIIQRQCFYHVTQMNFNVLQPSVYCHLVVLGSNLSTQKVTKSCKEQRNDRVDESITRQKSPESINFFRPILNEPSSALFIQTFVSSGLQIFDAKMSPEDPF